jgi:hypothetical protein
MEASRFLPIFACVVTASLAFAVPGVAEVRIMPRPAPASPASVSETAARPPSPPAATPTPAPGGAGREPFASASPPPPPAQAAVPAQPAPMPAQTSSTPVQPAPAPAQLAAPRRDLGAADGFGFKLRGAETSEIASESATPTVSETDRATSSESHGDRAADRRVGALYSASHPEPVSSRSRVRLETPDQFRDRCATDGGAMLGGGKYGVCVIR